MPGSIRFRPQAVIDAERCAVYLGLQNYLAAGRFLDALERIFPTHAPQASQTGPSRAMTTRAGATHLPRRRGTIMRTISQS